MKGIRVRSLRFRRLTQTPFNPNGFWFGTSFALLVSLSAWSGVASAANWPSWRGPEQSGAAREAASVTSWSPTGENLLWKVAVGGRTTPILQDGRLFLITPIGEGIGLRERVICLDADTGRTLWEQAFNIFHTDVVENRVGWTAVAADPETGSIFAHGTGGELLAFNRDGRLLWEVSLTEEFGRISGYGGRLMNPVIDEERVIVNFMNSGWGDQAPGMQRYVALDKRTGQVLWWATPGGRAEIPDTTYSTPVVAVIDGVRMLIGGNTDGRVYGMKARTGEVLWSFRVSKLGLNASVVVDGNFVYATHSEENISGTEMGAVVCIDATKRGDITESGQVWRVEGCEAGYASPAVANGRLYVVDNSGNLFCFDARSGARQWIHNLGRVGKGSPVVTQDKVIYVADQTGVFHVLRDEGDRCNSLDREEFKRPDNAVVEIFGSPAVAGGRVYFMTRYDTFCLSRKDAGSASASPPAVIPEAVAQNTAATFLQVRPGEITLSPGTSTTFTGRFFDANGREAAGGPIEWSLAGPKGTIESNGTFVAAKESRFSAGHVVAKSGNLEAKARVRISPALPIREDFESMPTDSAPPGWVGTPRKTKIVERDGGKVLQKLADDPSAPFLRIKGFMSAPIAGGYTIEADMLGTPKGERFKPDMGLINSRYELTLMAATTKQLRVESWTPIPRLRKDVPFEWDTNKWYRMKFQVKLEDGKALLRGKVWPRGAPEPKEWSLEFEDPYPNLEGSPGVYAFSPGTTPKSKGPEVFFDNVQVTANEE